MLIFFTSFTSYKGINSHSHEFHSFSIVYMTYVHVSYHLDNNLFWSCDFKTKPFGISCTCCVLRERHAKCDLQSITLTLKHRGGNIIHECRMTRCREGSIIEAMYSMVKS